MKRDVLDGGKRRYSATTTLGGNLADVFQADSDPAISDVAKERVP